MDDNLVGFVLGALDAETRGQVETYLQENPEANHRLELIRRALEPLASDKDEIEPEPGLVHRTIGRVAEYRCRPLPAAPPPPAPTVAPTERRWWERVDLLVAASLFLLLGGVSMVGIFQVRQMQQRLACENTLKNFHTALTVYSNRKGGEYPKVERDGPMSFAGALIPTLLEDGSLTESSAIQCPGNGPKPAKIPTLQELRDMSPEQRERVAPSLLNSYAYTLGFTDPSGRLCGLSNCPEDDVLNHDQLPIMADRPQILAGGARANSPNHEGQNVLTVGGNVRFWKTISAGIDNDDIYRNRDGKVGAGVDRWDTVLGTGADKP
jgi:hypothetical protein